MIKLIFLIISSNDLPVYNTMKEIIRIYCKKMKLQYSLEYFFVELIDNNEKDIALVNDTIFVKGKETLVPGILIKTIKSMEFINNNYQYQYLIRTNLSSFWNIPYLYNFMNYFTPQNFVSGIIIFNSFISGTGIILSKDVCIRLTNVIVIDEGNPDDVYLSRFLINLANICRLDDNKMYYLINGPENIIPEDISEILYFRVKSEDRSYDILAFKNLLKKIYDIDYDESEHNRAFPDGP